MSPALRVVRLAAPDDPRLQGYALAARPAALRNQGWFVAEGRLVVERLLLERPLPERLLPERPYEIESLLLSESAFAQLEPVLEQQGLSAPVYVCPAPLFECLTGHDFHRGCLALVRRPAVTAWSALAARAQALVLLEAVANADNVGGVFRNAAAFGADGVLLDSSSADPLYRKAIRTSMAASLRVPFAVLSGGGDDWYECLEALGERGFELIALTPAASARDLDAYAASPERAQRFALLLGAEGPGLRARTLELARVRLRIAIRPEVDSLNLAVACGIALQRLMRR